MEILLIFLVFAALAVSVTALLGGGNPHIAAVEALDREIEHNSGEVGNGVAQDEPDAGAGDVIFKHAGHCVRGKIVSEDGNQFWIFTKKLPTTGRPYQAKRRRHEIEFLQ